MVDTVSPVSPVRMGIVEPREAVATFQRRGLLQPSYRWQDTWQEEHSQAFAVAGVQRLDVLQVLHDALESKFKEGTSLAEFAKTVRPQLTAKGWWGDVETKDPVSGETRITKFDDRRLQLIYDVNVRQSYAAGQWARIERNKKRMPFLIYKTMDDGHVRAAHKAWHNLVLPVEHEFWHTHFPPNGWRCRCKAIAIDQVGIDRLVAAGQKFTFEAPPEQLINYVNPRTGEVAAVPRGIDPGFAYNPGRTRDAALYEQSLRKAWAAAPLSAAVAVAQATFERAEMVAAATERFGAWVDDIQKQMGDGQFHTQGHLQYVGALKPAVVRKLDRLGMAPDSAAIAVRDEDVMHTLRASKIDAGVGVDPSVYKRLPELLERASAILLDQSKDRLALLHVVDLMQADGQVAKLVVQIDQPVTVRIDGKRTRVNLNVVRTVTVMQPKALQDRKQYQLLWGQV